MSQPGPGDDTNQQKSRACADCRSTSGPFVLGAFSRLRCKDCDLQPAGSRRHGAQRPRFTPSATNELPPLWLQDPRVPSNQQQPHICAQCRKSVGTLMATESGELHCFECGLGPGWNRGREAQRARDNPPPVIQQLPIPFRAPQASYQQPVVPLRQQHQSPAHQTFTRQPTGPQNYRHPAQSSSANAPGVNRSNYPNRTAPRPMGRPIPPDYEGRVQPNPAVSRTRWTVSTSDPNLAQQRQTNAGVRTSGFAGSLPGAPSRERPVAQPHQQLSARGRPQSPARQRSSSQQPADSRGRSPARQRSSSRPPVRLEGGSPARQRPSSRQPAEPRGRSLDRGPPGASPPSRKRARDSSRSGGSPTNLDLPKNHRGQ